MPRLLELEVRRVRRPVITRPCECGMHLKQVTVRYVKSKNYGKVARVHCRACSRSTHFSYAKNVSRAIVDWNLGDLAIQGEKFKRLAAQRLIQIRDSVQPGAKKV